MKSENGLHSPSFSAVSGLTAETSETLVHIFDMKTDKSSYH